VSKYKHNIQTFTDTDLFNFNPFSNQNTITVKAPFVGKNAIHNNLKPSFNVAEKQASPLFMSAVEDAVAVDAMADYVKSRGGDRPIRKILIANNGMAATKSILSMRQWAYMELGDEKAIQFVAMATPEDLKANAEYIRLADSFVEVPAGKNLNNYATVLLIVWESSSLDPPDPL
jgi:hypothetical protein